MGQDLVAWVSNPFRKAAEKTTVPALVSNYTPSVALLASAQVDSKGPVGKDRLLQNLQGLMEMAELSF